MNTLNLDCINNMQTHVGQAAQALDVSEHAIKFKNTQKVTVQSKNESLYNFKDLHADTTIDDKTAAKNWYIRQQLLDKIRTDLDKNGIENVTENEFFKFAEQVLFGKDEKGAYVAEVGLSDLSVGTARSLLLGLKSRIDRHKAINLPKQKEVPNEQKVENKPEVKVGKTQLEAARKSCERYIEMLKAQREEQLQIIRKAGFTSDADEWILDNLKAKYNELIEYVQTDILDKLGDVDSDDIEDALGLDKGGLAKLKVPLADEQLKAEIFSDVKAALSRTLCSLMLFSQYSFKNPDPARKQQIVEALEEKMDGVFGLNKPEDFTTKLDRVKALIQPEGAGSSTCIMKFFEDFVGKFLKREISSKYCKFEDLDLDYVAKEAKFAGFVNYFARSYEWGFDSSLRRYLREGKPIDMKKVGVDYMENLRNSNDNPMNEVRKYLDRVFDLNVSCSGSKYSIDYAKWVYNEFCKLQSEKCPSGAFGGMIEKIKGDRPSDYALSSQCSTVDGLIQMLQDNFLNKMKSGYEKLLAKTDDPTKQKILKFQQEKEEEILNDSINTIKDEAETHMFKSGSQYDKKPKRK